MSTRHRQGPVRTGAFCVAVAFVCLASFSLRASESFRDDFTNPDPTNPGRDPVTWRLLGDEITIADGQLVFGVSGFLAGVAVDGFSASNLAVEAQFQILSGSQGGVFLRQAVTGDDSRYFGNLRTSDHIEYPGRADIWRNDPSGSTPLTPFTLVDFDPDGVVKMRLQAVDDDLSLWVWPAGTDRPQEPFLTAEDGTYHSGEVGLYVADFPDSQLARMAVDYFEVTVIPDPLLGDYDGSGMVGAGDLGLVLGSWGSDMIPPEWVNQIPMGTVGASELSVVLNEWGNSASLLAIPEPSSVVLMCLGLTAFVCRSR